MPEPRKKPPGGGSPRFRKSNQAADGSYPVPPRKHVQEPASTSDLAGVTPEDMIRAAAPEAIKMAIGIMRRPGRNARAQLAAAKLLIEMGTSAPPAHMEHSGKDGGAIQSELRIVFGKE